MSNLLAYRKTVPWDDEEKILVNGLSCVYEIPNEFYEQQRWVKRVKSGNEGDVVVRLPMGIRLTIQALRLMGARVFLPARWRESNYQ